MSGTAIGIATAIVGGTGLLIGLVLGLFQKVFAVQVDEREAKVRECLPGNNCGGCGYAGCDSLAQAIASGEAAVTSCPVAGAEGAQRIAAIMGVKAEKIERKTAFVKCAGTCDKAKDSATYYGAISCGQAAMAPGHGGKACPYGCTGLGSCVQACQFGAIRIVNGVARVNKEICTACGMCVKTCPYHLIELVPYDAASGVQCSSHDFGKRVRATCAAGCIACGRCVKACLSDAITLENNVAHIDQEKCSRCGACREVCPSKIIRVPSLPEEA